VKAGKRRKQYETRQKRRRVESCDKCPASSSTGASEDTDDEEVIDDIELPSHVLAQHTAQLLARLADSCLPMKDNRLSMLGLILQGTKVCI
jgi:hypothetical protein